MDVKPGDEFYGVKCRACGSPIEIRKTEPAQNVTFEGPGALRLTCLKCHAQDLYPPGLVERFRAE